MIENIETGADELGPDETDQLLTAADLVTRARTGVDFDYKGDVIDAHAPEMPTRFAKQLTQIVFGAIAIGLSRYDAIRLAIRCARDSMPPLRLAIIDELARPEVVSRTVADLSRSMKKPRTTIRRQCQALHMLSVLDMEEIRVRDRDEYHYSLAADVHVDAVRVPPTPSPDLAGAR